ncbi:unnamed protein product, partial [Iphiclides podalirius]
MLQNKRRARFENTSAPFVRVLAKAPTDGAAADFKVIGGGEADISVPTRINQFGPVPRAAEDRAEKLLTNVAPAPFNQLIT